MKDEKPVSKGVAAAIRTPKWAVTITKWRIGAETGGKKLAGNIKRSKRWQIVPFPGPNDIESARVVDLLAIRRDHRTTNRIIKRGDLLEIILVKGGSARKPSNDVQRLSRRQEALSLRPSYFASWKKGSQPTFCLLQNFNRKSFDPKNAWQPVDSGFLFR